MTEHALSRAAGAPLLSGNSVELLRDAAENYPAWLSALAAAKQTILFESYFVADDEVGRQFVDLLAQRARAGIQVRVLDDWMGALGVGSSRLWRPLLAAGGEVRHFNPPQLDSPFGWLSRDHRKSIIIDGEVGFVSGLCVSKRWLGDPVRGILPWRDTGVAVRGPAVADLTYAFARVWQVCGEPLSLDNFAPAELTSPAGTVHLRVVATEPTLADLYRLDQLIAASAEQRLWLTDAYYVGVAPYVQALRAAAMDGVDVRLLVPGTTDVPVLRPMSLLGYRPLLEAGVRVYEWNGRMLHAKTAVADGRWARVGSTNLNLASFVGNYELDVSIEDEGFARQMEDQYLADLAGATEVTLERAERRRRMNGPRPAIDRRAWRSWKQERDAKRRVRREAREVRKQSRRARRSGARAAAAGALRLAQSVGAVIGGRRQLGPAEAHVAAWSGFMLLLLAAVPALWPRIAAFPVATLMGWLSIALLVRAYRLWRTHRRTLEQAAPRHPSNEPQDATVEDVDPKV